MKKLIPILIAIPIAVIVMAADSVTVETTNLGIITNTLSTAKGVDGYIEAIKIVPSITSTSAVTIAVGGETVYANATLTGTVTVRPRFTTLTPAGATWTGGTNATARFYCVNEKIDVTISELNALTNTVKVTIKLDDK